MADCGPSVPARLLQSLEACVRGELAPNVALMRLVMEARNAAEIDNALAAMNQSAANSEPIAVARALWGKSPDAFETVKAILEKAEHTRTGELADPARWAAVFDHVAEISPEAGVALYSLGSPALLDAATADVVQRIREWGLLASDKIVLDLGCGMGRICAALAGEVRSIVGTDVSGRMLAIARQRCAAHGNVLLLQTSGRDLAPLPDGTFDLVLAVDSFPYLVLAGERFVAAHLSEARRVLKPSGSLVLFNYAYYGSECEAEAEFLRLLATSGGYDPVRIGTRDLACWDGVTYHVRRCA